MTENVKRFLAHRGWVLALGLFFLAWAINFVLYCSEHSIAGIHIGQLTLSQVHIGYGFGLTISVLAGGILAASMLNATSTGS